jgi:prolyl oligopeptidase
MAPCVPARREDLVYSLFGRDIRDPYRWLEEGQSAEVKAWVLAQNRHTRAHLDRIPERLAFRQRLEELLEVGDVYLPTVCQKPNGIPRYFYRRRAGGQHQPVLWVRDGLNGPERQLLDPNRVKSDGTLALDWYVPSADGTWLCYGMSTGGTEESTLRVLSVESGSPLPLTISRTRNASVAWKADNSGFFYTRFAVPETVPLGQENYLRRVYHHVLGRDPEKDAVVFEPHDPTGYPTCQLSPNGRWLVVTTHHGWNRAELFLANACELPYRFVRLTPELDHLYRAIVRDQALYVISDEARPRYALWSVDPERPNRSEWRLLIPQHEVDVLADCEAVGGELLVTYLSRAASRLERFELTGKSRGTVELPALGTSDGFSGWHAGSEAFFAFESLCRPREIQRLDLTTGEVQSWQSVASSMHADAFTVTRSQTQSKDGTWIPYWIARRAEVALGTGRAPTLLYGYGGFNVSLLPRFSRANSVFLERGGVYVQANLRGGGEFGEEWHRAGQLGQKQNVFDDFIAVAEALIRDRVTSPDRLAIFGRSNGGLLTLAALTQRPELFRVVVSGVPLADMLRYHRFLLARLWEPEYGSPDRPAEFPALFCYSPYHHVEENTPYPAVLLTTAESDTRVDPLHARKMAASLQYATSSGHPVLLWSEECAGHGAGKPTPKVAEEYADLFAFVLSELGEIDRDQAG